MVDFSNMFLLRMFMFNTINALNQELTLRLFEIDLEFDSHYKWLVSDIGWCI